MFSNTRHPSFLLPSSLACIFNLTETPAFLPFLTGNNPSYLNVTILLQSISSPNVPFQHLHPNKKGKKCPSQVKMMHASHMKEKKKTILTSTHNHVACIHTFFLKGLKGIVCYIQKIKWGALGSISKLHAPFQIGYIGH